MIDLTIHIAERKVDGGTIVDIAIRAAGDSCTKLERLHADLIEKSLKKGLRELVTTATESGIGAAYREISNQPN